MKKIAFKDDFFETEDILKGIKTQFRKPIGNICYIKENSKNINLIDNYLNNPLLINKSKPSFKTGEIVAISQCYEYLVNEGILDCYKPGSFQYEDWYESIGRTNKLYVRADLMPHHIHITHVKQERLQDIKKIDCKREGIKKSKNKYYYESIRNNKTIRHEYSDIKEAYKDYIEKMWGKNLWDINPLVWVYNFELVD